MSESYGFPTGAIFDLDTSLDARRQQFLDLISDHSESMWAAGWMDGIEKDIRAAGGLWIAVAASCQGWPIGYRAEDGWDPLTADEMDALRSMTIGENNV